MGLFDLPVEELFRYEGTNPKPADFDVFWDESLKEMEALDPQVKLKPAYEHPLFRCFDLTYTGTAGARIYAKLVLPAQISAPVPAVLQFHGLSASSGDWSGLFSTASCGFAVAAMDVRGQGGKSQDPGGVSGNTLHGHIIRGLETEDPKALFFRHVFLDTALLFRIVAGMNEIDENRIAVQGGSQGGGLSLACAALAPVKLASVCYPYLSDYQRAWNLDLAKDAYQDLTDFFRHTDPTHSREKEIFTRLGYIDIQHLAPRITAKVRMYTGLMDTICPPSTQFAAYNKIRAKKTVTFYPDFGHEWFPGQGDDTMAWFLKEL